MFQLNSESNPLNAFLNRTLGPAVPVGQGGVGPPEVLVAVESVDRVVVRAERLAVGGRGRGAGHVVSAGVVGRAAEERAAASASAAVDAVTGG